eukprot:1156736-Pelagomonas_calceolata.AAC.1
MATEDFGSQIINSSWIVLLECGIEPYQIKCFRAAIRLQSVLVYRNSPLLQKGFHADISFSSRKNTSGVTAKLAVKRVD